MDALLNLKPGKWMLVVADRPAHSLLLTVAARLAERGPLTILDGGNLSDVHAMARTANWSADVLERIYISRAFTCHQMASMLEAARTGAAPILLLDFLNTFYDQNVPFFDRRHLLGRCLRQIDFLGRGAGLVVTASPPPQKAGDSLGLFRLVVANAPEVLAPESPAPAVRQERLF
jgi:hypothetical protein